MSFFKKKAPKVYPSHVIVGLGNPGAQYRGTRHNVGFDVVDELGKRHGIRVDRNKHSALVGEGEVMGISVALVKPLTYMNLSGNAVKPILRMYGLEAGDLMVVADDLDMAVGKVRMRMQGSSGGHNGHKHLIQVLGTQEYARLKIGIGKGGETVDHVLSRFKPDEKVLVGEAVGRCCDAVEVWLTEGSDRAMLVANSGGGA